MPRTMLWLFSALVLSSCTLGEAPQVPDLPSLPPALTSPVDVCVLPMADKLPALPVARLTPAALPAPSPAPAPPLPVLPEASPGRKRQAPARTPRPEQILQEAHQAALVEPTRDGFFGGSGVQRFLWVPGKIYKIYLTPGQATKLTFPPGEVLAHALMLNPKSFDVAMTTVGTDVVTWSVVLILPCVPGQEECVASPEVDVPMTSTSGRGYNLRFVVGKKTGLVEATWELGPIPHVQVDDSPSPPPRRHP